MQSRYTQQGCSRPVFDVVQLPGTSDDRAGFSSPHSIQSCAALYCTAVLYWLFWLSFGVSCSNLMMVFFFPHNSLWCHLPARISRSKAQRTAKTSRLKIHWKVSTEWNEWPASTLINICYKQLSCDWACCTDSSSSTALLYKPVDRVTRSTLVLHVSPACLTETCCSISFVWELSGFSLSFFLFIFKDLLKHTPSSHPDYPLLQDALRISQNFLSSINEEITPRRQSMTVKKGEVSVTSSANSSPQSYTDGSVTQGW